MDVSNTTRIAMLGKTGTGKSSLANTIFGEELFTINHTANSETRKCQAETKSVNGRNITLIDTPGFFDTDRSEEELKPEIVKCVTECAPGPHAFLIVLDVKKYTKHEQAVITEINQYFTEEVFKYATVVFTHGDQLDEGQTIEKFVHKNAILSDLIKKCGGRCHVIDNKNCKKNQQDEYRNNKFQVEELLKTIDTMIEANEGNCYINEMLQAVEEEIQQEEELIRQSSGNMSEEEVREQAKRRVIIKLAGAATGALLGALFGSLAQGRVVVAALKAGLAIAKSERLGGATATAAAAAGVAAEVAVKSIIGGPMLTPTIGAAAGGVAGYFAAEKADTVLEAVKTAAKAVKSGYTFISDEVNDVNKI